MSDVFGQADPAVDVPAVQQAVDAGGTVVLHGTFSFEDVSVAGPDPDESRVILVSAAVVIRGEDAKVLGGGSAAQGGRQAVIRVDAPGADVTLEGIRFVGGHMAAIRVGRAGDLRIADCRIEDLVPSLVTGGPAPQNAALAVDIRGGPFGSVEILDNRIIHDVNGEDSFGGIFVIGRCDDLRVAGNRIDGSTSHGMDFRNVAGPARIEDNAIKTGTFGREGTPGNFVNALRLLGTGAYVVEENRLDCGFRNAAVVRVAATTGAIVRKNQIVASVPNDQVPGAQCAGVQVQGSASGNQIIENRIRGRSRVAMSVIHSDFPLDKPTGTSGNPTDTTLRKNNHVDFDATLATAEVGPGAQDTKLIGGGGTIIDEGTGTVIDGGFQVIPIPMP
ncbi:MAG TPA: right-handed parallel beta-helix repeat-containing protein [Longimicrobiales bacterium]|nr:right-handed parallel beta-helix repeat-containing protein [Longimicrobiales bacterium]